MNSAFVEALADSHQEGEVDLRALRKDCLTAIASGDGSVAFISSASLNGKGATQECKMDAAELLGAVNQALRMVNGTSVSLTYADFSQLR